MQKSMIHWNGNQICAVDVETTGLDPNYHEIIQICVLPLDSNIGIRKDVRPFYINIAPDYPERVDKAAVKLREGTFTESCKTGFNSTKAIDLFEEWMQKLGLPSTKGGRPKRIIPLGHNYGFDKSFIESWLGTELYEIYFHFDYRDTMRIASFLNDRSGMHVEKIAFIKKNLKWLCNHFGIEVHDMHDALEDCKATAAVYQKLLFLDLPGQSILGA